MNKQLYTILYYYLKNTGVFFNKSKLKQMLVSHPDNNSFYVMVDVLDELSIENVTLRLDMECLLANGFPAIVHTQKDGGTFIVIVDIIEDKVHYYTAESGRTIEPLDEFASKWSGIALYATQNEIQAELERKKASSEKLLFRWRTFLAVMAGLAGIVIWSVSAAWTFTLICFTSLCVIGLTVSILLTMHEFGESNRLLHKVCHLNRLTNCNAVLHSSAAKLFGWLSMSDIGLCYFVGSIFSLILAGITQQLDVAIPWLLALALCSFPYTVFSLWYQTFKVKKLCPLCLGVITVLWAEIAFAIPNWAGLTFFPLSSETVFSLFTGFALPMIIWAYVKPLWKEYIRIRNYEYLYLRLKRTPEVLRAMLAKGPAYDMEFSQDEIHLGKIDAPIHITVVLSFFCQPCTDGWNILNRLLTTYSDMLCVTVRFFDYNISGTAIEDLIDDLTGLYLQSGNDAFREALTDWYAYKDFQEWNEKYHATVLIKPQSSSSKNTKWEHSNNIASFPSLFVGDRIFPYALDDLEYLLKE